MASIYYRLDKSGNKRYYGSIYNNGKRTRQFLGCSRKSAQVLIKKFEYELLLNIESSIIESKSKSFEQAIISFKKDIERTGVKVKQISAITTKVNYFKDYCFLIGIMELDAYACVWENIGDMTYAHQISSRSLINFCP